LTFLPQNKRVSRTHGGPYLYVKFGDPSYISFLDIVRKKRHK